MPSAVQNFTVTEVTFTTVKLSWSPPAQPNGNILRYNLTYTETDNHNSYTSQNIDMLSTRYTVIGICPGVEYNITIRAVTSAGEGDTASVTSLTRPLSE